MRFSKKAFQGAHRRVLLRQTRKQWERATILASVGDSPSATDDTLGPGEEQLFSFYQPGLQDGSHTITVTQTLSTDPREKKGVQSVPLSSTQSFLVQGPQYSLPDGSIHSSYPPQGHADEAHILPHVVLTDPLLPWAREAIDKATAEKAADYALNQVPWLAVLVFEPDELRFSSYQPPGQPTIPPAVVQAQDNTNFFVRLSLGDLRGLKSAVTAPLDPGVADSQVANFIFIRAADFTNLVNTYDSNGAPVSGQTVPDLSRYKYLAHARHINMAGMPGGDPDEVGTFSVVFAHRTGPWDRPVPTTMTAHLVSLEYVHQTVTLPVATPYVALCSLYSWTYTVLPEGSLNLLDAFTNLGDTMAVLAPPKTVWEPFVSSTDPISQRVGQRLRDGYVFVRQRVQTGEVTTALSRGPLLPTDAPAPPLTPKWTTQSNFGTDLQILDKELGTMDISYSTAWSLGKIMAIADSSFAMALGRYRKVITTGAQAEAATALLLRSGTATHAKFAVSAKDVASSLPRTLEAIDGLHNERADDRARWLRRTNLKSIDLSFANKDMRTVFRDKAKDVASNLALSTMAHPIGSGNMLFNEHNTPVSSDWAIIVGWLLDRYHLYSIPAHYLIPDQKFLPKESLRFFSIDANWIDAFIDGALSVANHKEGEEDTVREAIKTAWNTYLDTVDPVLGYKPPVPTFGFLLRSDVVKKFPDLRIDAPRTGTVAGDSTQPPPLIRQDLIAEDTFLVLFDRVPSASEGGLATLTFSQPPHQQRFAAAQNVGPIAEANNRIGFELEYKDIFTSFPWPSNIKNDAGKATTYQDTPPSPLFDWDSRCLIVPNFAENVFEFLGKNMPSQGGEFAEAFPSAAMMALQLNDALLNLSIAYKGNTTLAFLLEEGNRVDEQPKTRTLALLEPRRPGQMAQRRDEWLAWRRSTAESSRQATPGAQGEGKETKPKMDTEAQLVQPVKRISQPPHYRSLRHPPSPPALASATRHIPGVTIRAGKLSPQYAVSIRSAGAKSIKKNTVAINNFAADLIISIAANFTTTIDDTWNLQEIRIDLPYGPASSTLSPSTTARDRVGGGHQPVVHNMISSYPGLGGRMLRNLRLNPLVKILPAADTPGLDRDILRIRLLPRATNAPNFTTPVSHNLDMSFMLNEAEICQYGEQTTVGFTWNEIYSPAKLVGQGSQQVVLMPVAQL